MKLTSLMTKSGRSQVFSKKRIAKRLISGGSKGSYSSKKSNNNYSNNDQGSLNGCYSIFKWGCLIFFVIPIVLVVILALLYPDSSSVEETFNVKQSVNFRIEANLESDILRVLEKDETVKILDSINNWFRIEDNKNLVGYVSKNYLNKNVISSTDYGSSFEKNPLPAILFVLSLLAIWILFQAYKTKCIYCNKRCRVFTKAHKECRIKYSESSDHIENEIKNYFDRFDEENFKEVDEIYNDKEFSKLEKIAEEGHVNLYLTLTNSLNSKLDHFLEDGVLSINEESFLAHFIEQFNLDQESYLTSFKIKHKIVKASILRDVLDGNPLISRVKFNGNLPFNFLNKEFLVYYDVSVEYFEKRIKTTYKGSSDGVSVKIMKGVYYRKSSFRGSPVKTLNTVSVGTGTLALTNKHLYFSSANKNFRIRFDRIVTVTPYEDGIGVQKEGVSSKPMTFSNLDGWFYYNFIMNADKIVETTTSSTERTRKISQTVKDKVWNRDQGKCVECGSNEKLEFDHIIPFSKGGANTYRNIQLLCEKCNREKSNNIG